MSEAVFVARRAGRVSYVERRRGRDESGWTRNRNVVRHEPRVKLGPVSHTVLVGFAVLLMGLIYLTQAGKVTGYDYEAVAIENEISELSAKRDDLAVENARMTSVAASRDSDVAANMVDGSVGGYVAE